MDAFKREEARGEDTSKNDKIKQKHSVLLDLTIILYIFILLIIIFKILYKIIVLLISYTLYKT